MDRTDLGRFLFTAEQLGHQRAALAVLLGLNGLRASEACDTDIRDLGFDRGHRTLRILGKGHKPAVIPLVPRTARTVDLLGCRCVTCNSQLAMPIRARPSSTTVDARTSTDTPPTLSSRSSLVHASKQ